MRRIAAAVVAVLLLSVAGCARPTSSLRTPIGLGARLWMERWRAVRSPKATVAGLKKLSASGQLDPEPQQWVDATISLLSVAKPEDIPADARKLIIDGCANNGYPRCRT